MITDFHRGQTLSWQQERVVFIEYVQALFGRLAKIETANGSKIVVSPIILSTIKKG